MPRIAFLGLGAMGGRMAVNLLAANPDLVVWNRNPVRAASLGEAGATIASSPRAAAEGAEFVFSMVRDDVASQAVWLDTNTGALAALRPDAVAIECSTLSLDGARTLRARFTAAERMFLDAPVVGSRPQAEQRQLIFLAGGSSETVALAQSVLLQMGSVVHHAGPAGAGTIAKLAVNAMFGIQVCAWGELIATIRRQGFDPARIAEVASATPVASPAARIAAQGMLSGKFAPQFPIEMVEKDFGYALAAAGASELAPMIAAAHSVFQAAAARGYGGENLTSIAHLFPSTA